MKMCGLAINLRTCDPMEQRELTPKVQWWAARCALGVPIVTGEMFIVPFELNDDGNKRLLKNWEIETLFHEAARQQLRQALVLVMRRFIRRCRCRSLLCLPVLLYTHQVGMEPTTSRLMKFQNDIFITKQPEMRMQMADSRVFDNLMKDRTESDGSGKGKAKRKVAGQKLVKSLCHTNQNT